MNTVSRLIREAEQDGNAALALAQTLRLNIVFVGPWVRIERDERLVSYIAVGRNRAAAVRKVLIDAAKKVSKNPDMIHPGLSA